MPKPSLKNSIKNIIFGLFIFALPFFLFAEDEGLISEPIEDLDSVFDYSASEETTPAPREKSQFSLQAESSLTPLKEQARFYREEGFKLHKIGKLDEAMSFYQKAIELDPTCAMVYNDLGIIYEAKELFDRAEECYLTATKADPDYLAAYTNLALLYEYKRNLKQAAFYWQKRLDLGVPGDPWTEKARQRLEDIRLVSRGGLNVITTREQEVIELTEDVILQKSVLRENNQELAMYYLDKARFSFQKGDDITAFKEAVNAQQFDPKNEEIKDFIEKIQTRVLSR